jgi:group I intron endonuclease
MTNDNFLELLPYNMCGIYVIKNTINNKRYIGQSIEIKGRFKRHIRELKNNVHGNDYLQKNWNKYGCCSFELNIIEYCLREELNQKEIYYINLYNSSNRNYGYNLTLGGQNGTIPNEETKIKISNKLRGKKRTNEIKEKMSGENHPMYGKHHTKETKLKISNAQKGKKLSQETISKIVKANKGRKMLDFVKQSLIKSHLGIPRSEETKLKIGNANKGKIPWNKGMKSKSQSVSKSHLNQQQINEIRQLLIEHKLTGKEIAKLYNVGQTTISRIKNKVLKNLH